MLASLGVANFTIRRILNHVESGPTQVYVRAAFDVEKKAALALWDRELRRIVFGETVDSKVLEFHG